VVGRRAAAEHRTEAPGHGDRCLLRPREADDALESGMRVLLLDAGLGPVRSQVHVPRVGWVDLLVQERVVVEVDGYAVHRDRFSEDRRRDAELARLGHVVLRFTYEQVLRRPGWVLDVVRDALRSAPGPRAVRRVSPEHPLGGQPA
jgi:very-short-patch-repair endonuclease